MASLGWLSEHTGDFLILESRLHWRNDVLDEVHLWFRKKTRTWGRPHGQRASSTGVSEQKWAVRREQRSHCELCLSTDASHVWHFRGMYLQKLVVSKVNGNNFLVENFPFCLWIGIPWLWSREKTFSTILRSPLALQVINSRLTYILYVPLREHPWLLPSSKCFPNVPD